MTHAPSATWRMLAQRTPPKPLPRGLDALWNAGLGVIQALMPRSSRFMARAERIAALQGEFASLSSSALIAEREELRGIFRRGRETPAHLDRAFALVREVAHRETGLRPHIVQIAAALALESGCIAEMATGEGKTLAATLAATVAGWRGHGCHIVTANDYLARRDAEWTAPIYRACGVTVASVRQESGSIDRKAAYAADITYCTSKEIAADYLRDRLTLGRSYAAAPSLLEHIAPDFAGSRGRSEASPDHLLLRGLERAIVDEADSVLIDEAVTPLILSAESPNEDEANAFAQAAAFASRLEADRDFVVSRRHNEATLTPAGRERVADMSRPLAGPWSGRRRAEELVSQALFARELHHRGVHYIVSGAKVVIVDEFTGRLMPDRSWRAGLHQAVEAKESLPITPAKETLARISFQRFFRMYRSLSGMTGTATEARREFWEVYALPVVRIPTNRPCIRTHAPDQMFASEDAKWRAITAEVAHFRQSGRPILIGARSVRASERVSALLTEAGLEHRVLNAERHAEEASIISGAGERGRITVATNMAGRGTDIKPDSDALALGGLHVIASERHDAERVDRQLFGRTGRQGDPGSAQAIISLEDDLVRRHAPILSALLRRLRPTPPTVSGAASELPRWLARVVILLAQRRAQRLARSMRRSVLRGDDWLDEMLGFAGAEV